MRERLNLLLRFMGYAMPSGRAFAAVLAFSALELGLGLVKPYLLEVFVDKALLPQSMRTFLAVGVAGALIFLLAELASAMREWTQEKLSGAAALRLHLKFARGFYCQSLDWLRRHKSGDGAFSLLNDADAAVVFATEVPRAALLLAARLAFTFLIVAVMEWRLAAAGAAASLLVYAHSRLWRRAADDAILLRDQTHMAVYSCLQETLPRMLAVKVFGAERREANRFALKTARYLRAERALALSRIKRQVSLNLAVKCAFGAVSLTGMWLVAKGGLSAGQLAAVMAYTAQLISAQGEAAALSAETAEGAAACRRLDKLSGQPRRTDGPRPHPSGGALCFERVAFGYDGADVLREISFSLPEGGHLAVAGVSGAGKTTLALLALGLYKPRAGVVTLGGEDICGLIPSEHISAALQDPMLCDGTIMENILCCGADAANAPLACATAAVAVLAETLPQGYNTAAGEAGSRLSRGQRQRVALARALAAKPALLVMDEALSSLEEPLEIEIMRAIRAGYPGMGLLVISHRMSAAALSDSVLWLKDGAAVVSCFAALSKNREFTASFAKKDDRL
ncbi:MAG: ABC transporter ATP-binding protein [Elusimicrobiales bacterium]